MRSYLIPALGSIWESIQSVGREVDYLPGFTSEMVRVLIDYLGSEFGVHLPAPHTDASLGNCLVVTCLTRHESQVLRTNIRKLPPIPISSVLELYGMTCVGGSEWWDFLSRQSTYFNSDDERLVITSFQAAPLFPTANNR